VDRAYKRTNPTHLDIPLLEGLLPLCVEVRRLGEHHHGGQVAGQRLGVDWIPHPVCWGGVKPLHHCGGEVGGGVACAEEQGKAGGVSGARRGGTETDEERDKERDTERMAGRGQINAGMNAGL
jgi:hypothetical protein